MSDPLGGLPLSAIRVFDAAARRRSFTRAAEDLGMTQAAVSWQIKNLERRLGQPLFHRLSREVALTPAAEPLARAAAEALALLRRAVADLTEADQSVLSITTLLSFASEWLAPRLGGFQLAHPDLAVRVDTSPDLADLRAGPFDLAIRSGNGRWPGMESRRLMPAALTPVCAPGSLAGVNAPRDLLNAQLIGDPREWSAWFSAAGVVEGAGRAPPRLTGDNQVMEVMAAIGGQGFALASPILYAGDIRAGRLERPFEPLIAFSPGYWLVWPEDRRALRKIVRFRDWITDAAARDPSVAEAERLLATR